MSSSGAKKYELVNLESGKKTVLEARSGSVGPDCLNIGGINKDHGIFTFDPGFMATAACESKITYIDGDNGVLLYRGYPIEQIATKSNFLETAYLLLQGELPIGGQLEQFDKSIRYHTMINETLLRFFNGFHYDAHPMAMVSAVVSSMAAFYHDSMDINNPRHREIFAHRILAKIRRSRRPRTSTCWASRSSIRATISITAPTCCTCSSRCLPKNTWSIRWRPRRSTCC
jgi:citrate synthase